MAHETLVDVGDLIAKNIGQSSAGWSEEVAGSNALQEEIGELRNALINYVRRTSRGSWALGKCHDPALKAIFVEVLRRQINGDAGELYQAMIALDNIDEPIFQGNSSSVLDVNRNRELSRQYLISQ